MVSLCHDVLVASHTTLHNVYFIPSFNVNLLSISKMVQSNTYTIQFTKTFAYVIDKVKKKTVGQGDLIKGHYFLPHSFLESSLHFTGAISSSM